MSVGEMLSSLIIGPLKLVFEVIFSLAHRVLSPGLSIVVLSLAVNLLVLPLYRRADALQEEERAKEQELSHWVNHIKATFKGDQRYMILQEYYRQNNYSPLHALKGALPLLLQIPFFIAAYQFLSGLSLLEGASFGPIADLSRPDSLLTTGGRTVHLLPILMTVINLISGSLYNRGMPIKSKVQLWLTALVFLILLYRSPSGLTLYWTLNNAFSLVKNLIRKSRNPRGVVHTICFIGGLFLLLFVFIKSGSLKIRILGIFCFIALQIPWIFERVGGNTLLRKVKHLQKAPSPRLFFLAAGALSVLTGLFIPSALLAASPVEFLDPNSVLNPIWYVVNAFLLAAGLFLFWMGVYYALGTDAMKNGMEAALWIMNGLALLNYLFFRGNLGTISTTLQYHQIPVFSLKDQLINLAVMLAASILLLLLITKWEKMARSVCLVLALAMSVMSVVHLGNAQAKIDEAYAILGQKQTEPLSVPLSRNGKNVIVLMLDRAISRYLPVVFYEHPELKASFSGFVYYPNTLSFGGHTNFATPALFGGYEYTPAEMNQRNKESLQDKHNEALMLMPSLFSSQNYTVTVCDPPYAGNYSVFSDLSMYQTLPNTHVSKTTGMFHYEEGDVETQKLLFRNFFCYAITKVVPTALFGTLYNNAYYNHPAEKGDHSLIQAATDRSKASGISSSFMGQYSVLSHLPDLTEIREDEGGTFLLMVNKATHEPMLLREPDYVPAANVDNTQYDLENENRFQQAEYPLIVDTYEQMAHYHVNAAALIQIGRWMDSLKEQGVYDQTRIIIVSDHGSDLGAIKEALLHEEKIEDAVDLMFFNPLLLVKDFDAEEPFHTDSTFMTNADVPTIAMNGLIDHPTNPFSGRRIDSSKKEENQFVIHSIWVIPDTNNGNTFIPDHWFAMKHEEDVSFFDQSQWVYEGIH